MVSPVAMHDFTDLCIPHVFTYTLQYEYSRSSITLEPLMFIPFWF